MTDLDSSSGTSSSNRLRNLRDLVTSANNFLPLPILHKLLILIFSLCALPDLDLAASTNDTHTHRAQQVVSSVAVHVDATVEHGSGILAEAAVDHGASSGVVLDEPRDVVDNAGDGDEAAAVLGLILEVVPFHDGEGLERYTPIELGALLVQLLLLLLDATLFDLV